MAESTAASVFSGLGIFFFLSLLAMIAYMTAIAVTSIIKFRKEGRGVKDHINDTVQPLVELTLTTVTDMGDALLYGLSQATFEIMEALKSKVNHDFGITYGGKNDCVKPKENNIIPVIGKQYL